MADTTTQTDAPAQSVNGRAPTLGADPAAEQSERWLGVLVVAAGLFLLFVGLDRLTGGALTAPFYGTQAQSDASG